jgi:hypothetical protein
MPRAAVLVGLVATLLTVRPATSAPPSPAPPSPAPPAAARGGYWLGVDLLGPAAAELGEGLLVQEPADVAPPGLLVGHVTEVELAIQWIADHAFEPPADPPPDPRLLLRDPAPVPAGGLLERHGALLSAFVLSGATADLRPRAIEWPQDQASILPPGSSFIPAALVPDRAPLFAAPAPRIPAAAERHAMAFRRGGLYLLGWRDRCTVDPDDGALVCQRWAQVVARHRDRFTPGYLPMVQVARSDAWIPSAEALPRAQLVPIGLAHGRAQWLLLARARDGVLHRRTLHAPATADGWPQSDLVIEGDLALVSLGDEPTLHLHLDATLDARPPDPDDEPTPPPGPTP